MPLEVMKKTVDEDIDMDQDEQEPIVKPGYGEMGRPLRKEYVKEQVEMASAGGLGKNKNTPMPKKKLVMKKIVKDEE